MWNLSMKLMEVVARLNGGLGTPLSWRSSDCTPDDLASLRSLSPLTSCATPASNSSDPGDPSGTGGSGSSSNHQPHESAYTIGVTENTPYACQFCDKAFPRLSYLKRHEQVHGDQMPFRCDFCHRLFKHKRSRDRHVKLHTGDRKYRCPHCEAAFSRSDHLKIHLKTHDNAKPFQCTVCNRGYNTAAALTSHMQNHKKGGGGGDGTQTPSPAGAPSPQHGLHRNGNRHNRSHSGGIAGHRNLTDGPTFRCLECSAIFGTARELQVHGEMHRERSRSSPLISPASLHQLHGGGGSSSSSTSPFLLPCAMCNYLCHGPDALRVHVDHVHRNACLLCREDFPNSQAYEKHLKLIHDCHVPIMNGLSSKESPVYRSPLLDARLTAPLSAKLTCGYCSKADFSTLEALHLHVQAIHIPVLPNNCNGNSPPSPNVLTTPTSVSQLRSSGSSSKSGNSTMYPCEYCTLRFSSVHALQKHTLGVHSFGDLGSKNRGGEPVFCSHCTMAFNNAQSLADHVRTVHESTPDNGAGGRSSRSDRRKSKSPERRNRPADSPGNDSKMAMVNGKGNSDEKADSRKNRLQTETNIFNGTSTSHFPHPGTLLCSQCSAGFQDFESFRSHLKTHLDSVVLKFTCPECDEDFTSEDGLDAHLVNHYLATTTEYGCQSCMKLFNKADDLQKHLLDMHAFHLYRCTLCKELFDSKVAIQVHFAVAHSNECRLFRCTTCVASVFRTLMDFQVHVRVVHLMQAKNQAQPFRCLLCDHSFSNELQLQLHAATHKKPFACSFCDEAFHVEFLLDKHLQTRHSGESQTGSRSKDAASLNGIGTDKAATSSSTTTELAQNLSLKSRSRSDNQTEESSVSPGSRKELKCDICDSTFPSENALANHRRQAHNIRTSGSQRTGQTTLSLYCAYCSESCKSRTELENHMKAHTVSPSKHKCNICDEICPSATTLAEHKLTHCKLVSGISCFVCRSSLKTEEQFYSHFQQHNNQGNGGNAQSGWPFPCVICRQSLASDVEVQMHAKFHLQKVLGEAPVVTGDLLFPCCVCVRRFESHHLIITGKQDCGHTYMCKDCFHSKSAAVGALVAASSSIREQTPATVPNDRDSPSDLRCLECQVKFESVSELESHRVTQHHKTYQCIKCQISFGSEAEITEHVTTHVLQEGTEHECRLCQRVFDSPSKLQCHLIEHTFEGCSSYTCYLCSTIFTSPHAIQKHMWEHGLNARPYDCDQCHQRFFFRAELDHHSYLHDNHVSMETDEKPAVLEPTFRCADCGENFSSANNLSNHRKKHHPARSESPSLGGPLSEGPLKCSLCPMAFHTSNEMQDHFFTIHGEELDNADDKEGGKSSLERQYECPECHERFSHSKNLSNHVKQHEEAKPYACPLCGKRFAHRENRRAHYKLHCGSKSYACQHCQETFSRRSKLKEHVKLNHSTEDGTMAQCESCPGTFGTVQLLRLHQAEVHQKSFEFSCPVCVDFFDCADQLEEHLRLCHDVSTSKTAEEPMEQVEDVGQSTNSPGQCSVTSSSGRDSVKPIAPTEISDNDSVKNESEIPEAMEESVSVLNDSPPAPSSNLDQTSVTE